MKKMLALILVFTLIPLCAFAETEYFQFAGILLSGQTLSSLKSSLEKVTGLPFYIENGQLYTDSEPPITYMGLPIYNIYATSDLFDSPTLSICLTPYEIDGYNNGTVKSFDNGIYDQIRQKVSGRFGVSSRMCINFFHGDINNPDSVNNAKSYLVSEAELPYILNDSCAFMFRNSYDGAYLEIYRKNTSESYIITNASDQSLYGNVSVAFVTPTFTYFAYDLEILIDEETYGSFTQFPMLNGEMQYLNDF